MTQGHDQASGRDGAGWYEIRLAGHLGERWAAWFDGSTISQESDGVTVLTGLVADQAALHGLLQRVRDLGLPLISVKRIDDALADPARSDARARTTARQGD
jgi:hypothetical protein